ncbi:MAG: FG-GAP repeat domain-containing protein, partial [Planctomycetota bacterium]
CASALASADLDGDADPDLVVQGDGIVSVALNNGDGTFSGWSGYQARTGWPGKIVLADLDADQDLDWAGGSPNTVSLLLNDGDGSFPLERHEVEPDPSVVEAADLDDDGDADLVVVCADAVSVVMNQGDGSFADHIAYAMESEPADVTAGDIDGDSDTDLIIASVDSVSVLVNDGQGVFVNGAQYPTGEAPDDSWIDVDVQPGDLNADGHLDLAVTRSWEDLVLVFLNDGRGGLVTGSAQPVSTPWGAAMADLNGDGALDLAVASDGHDAVSILINEGAATFRPAMTFAAGPRPRSLAARDLDGDGDVDLAVAGGTNLELEQGVTVLFNDGSGDFSQRVSHAVGHRAVEIKAGDVDADGRLDLAVVVSGCIGGPMCQYAPIGFGHQVSILLGRGDGSFTDHLAYGVSTTSLALADLDLDGRLDVAVDGWSNDIWVLRNISVSDRACESDVTGDGCVNGDDLTRVLRGWGLQGGREDVNDDGIVDVDDLLAVILAWGPCGQGGGCS